MEYFIIYLDDSNDLHRKQFASEAEARTWGIENNTKFVSVSGEKLLISLEFSC